MSTVIALAKTVSKCELGDMELKNEFLLEVEVYDHYIEKRNKNVGTIGRWRWTVDGCWPYKTKEQERRKKRCSVKKLETYY